MPYSGSKKVGVIIVAGGSSERMNGIDKQMTPLCGIPVILHSVNLFQRMQIDEIAIVASENNRKKIENLVLNNNVKGIRGVVKGGVNRSLSVGAGYRLLSSACELIAVHDGARPLLTEELAEKVMLDAEKFGAAALAVPVRDTIKIIDGMCFQSTPDRNTLYAVQTPQAFRRYIFDKMLCSGIRGTDDASVAEKLGYQVRITMGDYTNIKITAPEDLTIAEALLNLRK